MVECPACWLSAALLCVASPSNTKRPAGRCLPSFVTKSDFTALLLLGYSAVVALKLQPFSLQMASRVCIISFDNFPFLVVWKALEGKEQVCKADNKHYYVSLSTVNSCGRVFKYCFSPGMQYWYPLLLQTAAHGIVIPCRIPLTIHDVCTVHLSSSKCPVLSNIQKLAPLGDNQEGNSSEDWCLN